MYLILKHANKGIQQGSPKGREKKYLQHSIQSIKKYTGVSKLTSNHLSKKKSTK